MPKKPKKIKTPMVITNFRSPVGERDAFKQACKKNGLTRSRVLRAFCNGYAFENGVSTHEIDPRQDYLPLIDKKPQ